MDRQYHRDMVIELGQNTSEMRVPCVAMDDVRIHTRGVEVCATTDGAKHRIQILGRTESRRIDAKSSNSQMRLVDFLMAKTAHLDVHYLCQFTTQVIDMNTCAPINVWGVLVRQKEGFHSGIKDRRRPEGKWGNGSAFWGNGSAGRRMGGSAWWRNGSADRRIGGSAFVRKRVDGSTGRRCEGTSGGAVLRGPAFT